MSPGRKAEEAHAGQGGFKPGDANYDTHRGVAGPVVVPRDSAEDGGHPVQSASPWLADSLPLVDPPKPFRNLKHIGPEEG